MLNSTSPYALLSASKPRSVPFITTAYDLYSMSQVHEECSGALQPSSPPSLPSDTHLSAANPVYPQAKKTHYVKDIHTKHASATARTAQHGSPLPPL